MDNHRRLRSNEPGFDIRTALMDKKDNRKIDPILLAQIENGVKPKDYLFEGCWIMEDISKMIETYKNGGYNNYIGPAGINTNASQNLESNRGSLMNYSSNRRNNSKYETN